MGDEGGRNHSNAKVAFRYIQMYCTAPTNESAVPCHHMSPTRFVSNSMPTFEGSVGQANSVPERPSFWSS